VPSGTRVGLHCARVSPARSSGWLAVAAGTFWLAWLLMPGVGITDAQRIFELVGTHRAQVLASSLLQLASAACYAPALIGVSAAHPPLRRGAALLLAGAMGSAADAVFHLFAYEMTAPGAAREALLPVMTRMQGPGLVWILPLIACFFAGSGVLLLAARRNGLAASDRRVWLGLGVGIALLVAAAVGLPGFPPGRAVGLSVLAGVCACQLQVAIAVARAARPMIL